MDPTAATPPESFAPPRRWAKWAAGGAAISYIGLSLYVPPPAAIVPPPLGAGWSERLFPGVPEAWILARIAAVVATLLFTALAAAGTWQATHLPQASRLRTLPAPAFVQAALAWAGVQVLVGLGAGMLPRSLQIIYIAALAGPALILYLGDRSLPERPQPPGADHRTPWLAVIAVAAIWLLVRVPGAAHSHWLATATDCFMTFDGLRDTLRPDYPLLTSSQRPGFTALLSILQGPTLLGLGPDELTPAWMQRFQIFWAVVAAMGLALLTARCFGRAIAPVAVAVFLFSPAQSMTTVFIGALFLGPLMAAALAVLWVRIAWDRAPWAVIACATLAGTCFTHPSLAPLGAISVLALLRCGFGVRAIDRRTLATAGLLLAAIVWPSLPSREAVASLGGTYTDARQMWAGMQAGAFGYIAPSLMEFQNRTGETTLRDIGLGMLLAPWMTPRTPLRLWGDLWFEPVGAALAAVGVGVVLANLRRSQVARGFGLFFLVTLAPGFISSYDRPSIIRAMALPLTTALMAAVGQAWFAGQSNGTRRRVGAAVVCLASGAAGIYVYDWVNPRILASSATAITLEALAAEPECLTAQLVVRADDVLHDALYARHLARCPLGVLHATEVAAALEPASATGLLFWSPGMEDEAEVGDTICRLQPQARRFAVRDSAGLSQVFVAALGLESWRPPFPEERWAAQPCGEPLPTESHLATTALQAAASSESLDKRIARLRETATRTFVQTDLYLELARALLQRGRHPEDANEARHWSGRAAAIHRWEDIEAARLRLRSDIALGVPPEADQALSRTVAMLRERGREDEAHELRRAMQAQGTSLDPG